MLNDPAGQGSGQHSSEGSPEDVEGAFLKKDRGKERAKEHRRQITATTQQNNSDRHPKNGGNMVNMVTEAGIRQSQGQISGKSATGSREQHPSADLEGTVTHVPSKVRFRVIVKQRIVPLTGVLRFINVWLQSDFQAFFSKALEIRLDSGSCGRIFSGFLDFEDG